MRDSKNKGGNMENLGNLLRRIREERGLTQVEFAALVGVKQSTLSIYETGHRVLKINTFERLISPLGLKPVVTIVVDEGE